MEVTDKYGLWGKELSLNLVKKDQRTLQGDFNGQCRYIDDMSSVKSRETDGRFI